MDDSSAAYDSAVEYQRQLDQTDSWSDTADPYDDRDEEAPEISAIGIRGKSSPSPVPRRAFDDSDVSLLSPVTGHLRRPSAQNPIIPFRAPLLNKLSDGVSECEDSLFAEMPTTPHTSALAVQHSSRKTGLFMTTWYVERDEREICPVSRLRAGFCPALACCQLIFIVSLRLLCP